MGAFVYLNARDVAPPLIARLKTRLSPRPEPDWWIMAVPGSFLLSDGVIEVTRGYWFAGALRLDNRAELLRSLSLEHSLSDLAVVGEAWFRWGRDMGRHLCGDFALVVVEAASGEVFALRDALGECPLYFHDGRAFFGLATSAACLSLVPEIGRAVNPRALWMWLQNDYDDRVSMYAGVEGLDWGQSLRHRNGRTEIQRYWRPGSLAPFSAAEQRDAGPAWVALLGRCVADRCRDSAGLVGTTISGGLDSSSVSALAAGAAGDLGFKLQAFSFKFDTMPSCDERDLSRATAAHLGVPQLFFEGDDHWLLRDVLLDGKQRESPFLGFSAFDNAMLARLAAMKGDVLLTGHGGDNINTGISERDLLGGGFQRGRLGDGLTLMRRYGFSFKSLLWRFCMAPMLPAHWVARLKPRRQAPPAWVLPDRVDEWRETADFLSEKPRYFKRHDRQALFELLVYHVAGVRRAIHYYKFLSPAYGIQVRHPYFDRRLVEFMLRLDPGLVRPGPLSKQFCRENMVDLLPAGVLNVHSKPLLGAFYHKGIDKERNKVKILMERSALADMNFIDQSSLLRCIEAFLEGDPNHELATFLTTVMVENWLQNEGFGP